MSENNISGMSSYYDYEQMMCVAPPANEPLISEPPPPPPKKDHYKSSTTAPKTPPAYAFLDDEEKVCKDPNISLPPQIPVDPALFTSTLYNSQMVAEMDLELTDHNGLNNRGQNDLEGTIVTGQVSVNHTLFDKTLFDLKGMKQENTADKTTTTVKDVRFDARERAYIFDMEVEKKFWFVPVWDNFQVKFKVDSQGRLIAGLQDNWFPDNKILDKLESTIRDKIRGKVPEQYRGLRLDVRKDGSHLELVPQIREMEIPISEHGSVTIEQAEGKQAHFNIDPIGNLHIQLKGIPIRGSTRQAPAAYDVAPESQQADSTHLNVRFGLGQDQSLQIYASGSADIHLDETETERIKTGKESLGSYFHSGTIKNTFSVYMKKEAGSEPSMQARNYVSIPDARMGEQTVHLSTAFAANYTETEGLKMETIEPVYPVSTLNTSVNGVNLMVNGSEYFPKMKALIGGARESIDLETYQLHDDQSGREVAWMLARKAAGLTTDPQKLTFDKQSTNGVNVRFIFSSWKGSKEDGARSEQVMQAALDGVEKEIQNSRMSPADKARARQQLHQNLKWRLFAEGILRSDHRKVLVVDGAEATVGGMNVGDKYLSGDSYHDLMIQIAGPEVRQIQREFIENWHEFNGQAPPTEAELAASLKSETELQQRLETLQADGKYTATARMGTLVTDDRQTDIEHGILKLIDEAQHEINIEQAFFSDPSINNHLAEAIRRGVQVNVVLAEDSIIDLFDQANLDSIQQLAAAKQQSEAGGVKLFYYQNNTGHETPHIHTKAITVDNQRAIVGSANMIGRSLSSPFAKVDSSGQASQLLFNKELSMIVDDPDFVRELNSRVFETDMVNHSREIGPQEIKTLVEKAGGLSEIRKKAFMALVT